MSRKPFLFVLLLVLCALPFAGASAQTTDQPCSLLSAEDCALYYSNVDQPLPTATAFDATFSVSATIEGDTLAFGGSATGGYAIDQIAADDALAAFQNVLLLDLSLRDVLTYLEDSMAAFDAELLILLDLPEEAMGAPMTFPLSLYLADGNAYLDFTPLAQFGLPFQGVYGLSVFGLIEEALEGVDVGTLMAFGDGFAQGMGDGGDFDFDAFVEALNESSRPQIDADDFTDEELAALFDALFTIERLDDDVIDGADVAVFQTTIDLRAIFEEELFIDAIIDAIEQQGTDMGDLDPREVIDALAAAIDDTTSFVYTESIGLDDNVTRGIDVNINLVLDMAAFAEALGETADTTDPASFSMLFSARRSEIGTFVPTLPADAQALSLQELINSFMMMSGGSGF